MFNVCWELLKESFRSLKLFHATVSNILQDMEFGGLSASALNGLKLIWFSFSLFLHCWLLLPTDISVRAYSNPHTLSSLICGFCCALSQEEKQPSIRAVLYLQKGWTGPRRLPRGPPWGKQIQCTGCETSILMAFFAYSRGCGSVPDSWGCQINDLQKVRYYVSAREQIKKPTIHLSDPNNICFIS